MLFATLACGRIGFVDDFIKIVKQALAGPVRALADGRAARDLGSCWSGWRSRWSGLPTTLTVPVLDDVVRDRRRRFFVVVFLVVAGAANAVNLTDGLDGLAAGICAIVLLSYTGIAFVTGQRDLAMLRRHPGRGVRRLPVVQLVPGAGLHGRHRLATRSGGAIAAMAVMTKTEILLVVIGAIFVAEALSVIIQVSCSSASGAGCS